jgi:CubicO group peptidase (beta-lactamase class C family)
MKTKSRSLLNLFLLIFLFAFVPPVLAQELSVVKPQEVGLSSERLDRIHKTMQEHVDKNHIAGAVMLIARHGKVAYLESVGMRDIEAKTPMQTDTIFRIASMTKPITSLAVMMLYEEGHFLLSDPISKFIPEFKNPKVAVRSNSDSPLVPPYVLVPAKREITIRDLLTHTSGITYRFWGRDYFADLYKKAGVSDGLIQTEGTIADEVKKLAQLPLTNQPGEAYEYGLNTDVLGYLVEVASGKTLDKFFQERIFTPLGMNDTYFFLPEEKLPRLSAVYTTNETGGIKKLSDDPVQEGEHTIYSANFQYKGPRTFFSGGAGLVPTITDYYRFLQMLLNGGELNGVRLVSRKTVELMRSTHTGNLNMWLGYPGDGFGLGFGVVRDIGQAGDMVGSAGTYYWGGFFSTTFWIDPKEDLIGILMTQFRPFSPYSILKQFRVLTYQAVGD